MIGQHGRQLIALDLHVDQVHGQREFVGVQKSVSVHVGELPDLAQHRIGQLRLDQLRLSGCIRHTARRQIVNSKSKKYTNKSRPIQSFIPAPEILPSTGFSCWNLASVLARSRPQIQSCSPTPALMPSVLPPNGDLIS